MKKETFRQKLARIPVPVLPTMVGAATLSNVYAGLGFTAVRHITMFIASVVLLCYLIKIVIHFETAKTEYQEVVPSSLYAAFTMLLMILGSYYFSWSQPIGKGMWLAAFGIHALHIIVFTIRNVITNRSKDTFLPTWFVTYDGILVSCVVGAEMNEQRLLTAVTYFGIIIYVILIVLMIWRLATHEVKDAVYHTQAIVMAPCSLCVTAYLNIIKEPQKVIVFLLYGCVVLSLGFVIYKLPKFLSYSFYPGFASLTFPMAIGIVASTKVAGYLDELGYKTVGMLVSQLSGIQIYLTTALVSYVLYHFIGMFVRSLKS